MEPISEELNIRPNRRNFITRLVGAAAIAPVIASISTSKAKACPSVDDAAEYLGPNLFNVYLSDPTGQTSAHGIATFEILSPDGSLDDTRVTYTLKLTSNAFAVEGFLVLEGVAVLGDLPLGTPATIQAIDYNLTSFAQALEAAAAGKLSMKLIVQVKGQTYTLIGKLVPAPNSQIIDISLCVANG